MLNNIPFKIYQQLIATPKDLSVIKYLNKASMTPICPFKVIEGVTNTTEAGYKPLNSNPNDYTQLARIWNGKEAFLVEWLNTYSLSQSSTRQDNKINHATKTFKVGDVYWGIFLNDNIGSNFAPYAGNDSFTSQQIIQQISLRIYNIDLNKKFFDNLSKSQLRVYILPEGLSTNQTSQQKANPYDDIDRNFLLIEQQNIERDSSNKIVYVDATFISIQDKLAHTGLTVNSYAQMGGPGEPYPFPSLRKNVTTNELEVILDPDRLKGLPITHAQVTLYGNAELVGYGFVGRPVYKGDDANLNKLEINEPNIILPRNFQGAIADTLSLRKAPENNYYWKCSAKYELISSRNLQQNIATIYSPFSRRNIQGLLSSNYDDTKKTNSNSSYGTVPFWDSRFLDSNNPGWTKCGGDTTLPIIGNDWMLFIYNNKVVIPDSTFTKNKFTFSQVKKKDFSHFNFFNWVVYKPLYEIPLTLDLVTPIAYGRYPIVGKLWNFFTLGLAPGFAKNDVILPKYSFINCLANVGLYNNYSLSLFADNVYATTLSSGANFAFKQLLGGFEPAKGTKLSSDNSITLGDYPMEVLYDNEADEVGSIIGTNATTTAFCSGLTHKAELNFFDETGKYLRDYLAETSVISQNLGNKFGVINENSVLQPKEATLTLGNIDKETIGYYIDLFNMKLNAKCDYQLKFFSYVGQGDNVVVDDKHCVYIAKLQTASKGANAVRLWNSTYKLSNPEYDFNKKFDYPQDLQPIPPDKVPSYTINLTETTGIWNYEKDIFQKETPLVKSNYGDISWISNKINLNVPLPDAGYKLHQITGDIQIQMGYETQTWKILRNLEGSVYVYDYSNKTIFSTVSPFRNFTFNYSFNDPLSVQNIYGIKFGDSSANLYKEFDWDTGASFKDKGVWTWTYTYLTANMNINLSSDNNNIYLDINKFPFGNGDNANLLYSSKVKELSDYPKSYSNDEGNLKLKIILANLKAIYTLI